MMRVEWKVDAELPATITAALEGYVDPDAATQVRDELLPHVGPETPKLLLDMSRVDWMGSAGVGSLMHLLARAQANRGMVALFGCAPRVRSVLHVCGLEAVLNVSESEAEARQRLAAS